ncbi:hypothetical protein K439DRAFT_1350402 [Ramaria rubella]|nr:hypothetical protein K439DRAFT_1350402 [Ramaria rubella]
MNFSFYRRKLPCIPSFWQDIRDAWKAVQVSLQERFLPYDLALSLSRFIRNLVAGVSQNQTEAFANEPEIRYLLHYLTSFSQLEDKNQYPLTRMLVQTLSNIITLNDAVGSRLWKVYTTLPDDQNILSRLLASPDMRTVNAALVLILNSINAEGRTISRITSPNGIRIIIQVLDRAEECVDEDSESSEENEIFAISYRLFETFIEQDLTATIYHILSIEEEPTTPHQTTFLKILDSYLRHSKRERQMSRSYDYAFLPTSFSLLCLFTQRALRRSLGAESLPLMTDQDSTTTENSRFINEDGLKELDLRLPKVSAAIILVAQCLTTILVQIHDDSREHTGGFMEAKHSGYDVVLAATQAAGFTLRLVDIFLPRIVFGEAVVAPGETKVPSGSFTDAKGFNYLKRDLVRLLGIICHERKDIQNRIRECGGIHVVMNLCVIDERNPYMQEHATFALRNILYKNPDNQAVVEALKPSAEQI